MEFYILKAILQIVGVIIFIKVTNHKKNYFSQFNLPNLSTGTVSLE
jgi:hypothetical protein